MSLQGKVEVIAPHRLYSFDLSKKDVGQTRTNDNLSVTLLKLEKNYAEIEYTNSAPVAPEVGETPLNPLIVQAKDTTGQFLSRAGSINETATQIAFYQKQLAKMQQQKAWSEAFEHQLDEEQRTFEKQQGRHYSKVYFNGPIETLEVSLLDFSSVTVTRKDLKLTVLSFDSHTTAKTIQPLTLPVVVYDDQVPNWLKGATLSEEQLKKASTSISRWKTRAQRVSSSLTPEASMTNCLATLSAPAIARSVLPRTVTANAMNRSNCRQRLTRSTLCAARSPMT